MRLVSGSSRYAIGAPSRNTTPCRFGLTIFIVGPPASPVPGVSVRVGLKRLRLAIILYACAGKCCGSGGGGPGPAGGGGGGGGHRLRRRDELLDDEPAAQERDASEHHVDDEQAARHQLLALPGTAGRTNPETVSVTSKSLGWVMLTTRILSSWTGRSFGALSSRASRSTSWRISQDTAISTGHSSNFV